MRLTPLLIALAIWTAGLAVAQPVLRLKSGRTPAPLTQPESLRYSSGAESYFIVQFDHEPGEADVELLAAKGLRAVAYVPDQALIVAGPADASLQGTGIVLATLLEAQDKFSPEFAGMDITEMTTAVVVLHEEGSANQARMLLSSLGFQLREHPDLAARHLLVYGPVSVLQQAATLPEIAYVLPASRELRRGEPVQACQGVAAPLARLLAAAELSASFGDGWDGPGAGTTNLRYYIGPNGTQYPDGIIMLELGKAVATWSAVVEVNFNQITTAKERRSIDIEFMPKDHGDGFPFDSRGRTLAHTFYPPPSAEPTAGDLHFDAEEPWQVGNDPDVFSVALHELGHALGLTHSDDPNSVMYPYYRRVTSVTQSDIESIRQLYKARGIPAEPSVPETPSAPENPAVPTLPPLPPLPPLIPPQNPEIPTTPTTPTAPTTPTTPEPPVLPPITPPANPETPEKPDVTPPALTITAPVSQVFITTDEKVFVSGTAHDDRKLKKVTWETGAGDAGLAEGTTNFKTGPIPLYKGINRIMIKAWDEAGNFSWRSLTVTRR